MKIGTQTAAVLAQVIYDINRHPSTEMVISDLTGQLGNHFDLPTTSLKGAYGIGIAKVKSHGGLLILGKNKYKGDAFLVFRGTQLLVDWGSNIDIATKSTQTGRVHAGFYKAMLSMQEQIRAFVQQAQQAGVVRFHCIGHSLGGAIAMLCADWLRSTFKITSYVYTFGAPRPGLINFAKRFERNFPKDRIHRVYHTGDIVPLIAPWPFVHAPDSKWSGRIVKGGNIPNVASHDIDLYVKSVQDEKWDDLITASEKSFGAKDLENWMLQKNDAATTGFTLSFIERVSAAIQHLLLNVLRDLAVMATVSISSAFTWYDFIACIFKKNLEITGRAAEMIFGLMNKLLRAMGLAAIADARELTRDKLRHVFMTFNARINHVAYQAVNHTLAGGKAL